MERGTRTRHPGCAALVRQPWQTRWRAVRSRPYRRRGGPGLLPGTPGLAHLRGVGPGGSTAPVKSAVVQLVAKVEGELKVVVGQRVDDDHGWRRTQTARRLSKCQKDSGTEWASRCRARGSAQRARPVSVSVGEVASVGPLLIGRTVRPAQPGYGASAKRRARCAALAATLLVA
jgi:hypothetical protein